MRVLTQQQIIDKTGLGFQIGEDGGCLKNLRVYMIEVDPPNLTTGAGEIGSVDVTCTGVAIDDVVLGFGFETDLADDYHYLSAQITAADTVRLFFRNGGATLSPAAAMGKIVVLQCQP